MQTLESVLSLLLPIVASFFGGFGLIPTALVPLVNQLATAIPSLIATITSGGKVTDDVLAILQSVQGAIAATDTSLLTPAQKALLNTLTGAISDAITAYQQAGVTEDISTLTPLPETL
jgi:hypothetical protein